MHIICNNILEIFRVDYSAEKAKEKEDRKQKKSEQKAKKNDTVSRTTIISCTSNNE